MKQSRTNNTVTNSITGVLYIVIHTLYSFILTGIVLKSFGSETNGLISSIKQIITYTSLIDGGLSAACIMSYYKPLACYDTKKISNIYFYSRRIYRNIGSVFFFILTGISIIYPLIVECEYDNVYISMLLFSIGANRGIQFLLLEEYKSLFTADQKNRLIQIALIWTDAISIIAVATLVYTGIVKDILIVEIIITLSTLIQLPLFRVYFKRNYSYIIEENDTDSSKRPIKQIGSSFVHMLASTVSYNTDIILLTVFRTLLEVSVYSVYNMVITMLNSLLSALIRGLESSIGNVFNQRRETFSIVFAQFENAYIMIDSIMMASIVLIMKSFISLYTGKDQAIDYWNFDILLMFVTITFFNLIRNPHGMLIRVSENLKSTQNFFVIEALINIATSLLLVRPLGIVGVLIGTLISVVIRDFYVISFVYKHVLMKSPTILIKNIVINTMPIVLCMFAVYTNMLLPCNNYLQLFRNVIVYGVLSVIIVIIFNLVFNFRNTIGMFKYSLKIITTIKNRNK